MTPAEFLLQLDLFRALPTDLRDVVADLFLEQSFDDDEVVFRAGDPATELYVVRAGSVSLYTDRVGEAVGLKARLEPGDMFGEVGVLEGGERSLSARASGPATLLSMHGESLIELARAYDTLAFELSKIAIRYSFDNQAAKAELGRRKEVRVKVCREVELRVAGSTPLPVVLENLSIGGACIVGLPASWDFEPSQTLSFGTEPTTALFSVRGRVTWRKRDRLGIAFTDTAEDHEMRIAGALFALLQTDQSPALTS